MWNGGVSDETLCLRFASKPFGQLLIGITTVADGHQANDSFFLFNGIDGTKAANAILSQPVQYRLERASALEQKDSQFLSCSVVVISYLKPTVN